MVRPGPKRPVTHAKLVPQYVTADVNVFALGGGREVLCLRRHNDDGSVTQIGRSAFSRAA